MKNFFRLLIILIFMPLDAEAATRELKILAAARLAPPSIAHKFQARHGIRVSFEYFETAEALDAYLESGAAGDLFLIRGHQLDALKNKNQLLPLDRKLLPNLRYMDKTYLDSPPDPGGEYSLPYLVGNIGLIYRRDLLGESPPNLSQIFDPNSRTATFSIMRQYRDAIGVALKYLDYSYNSDDNMEIEAAISLLKSLNERPSFIGFLDPGETMRFLDDSMSYMAVSYNNEAARLIMDDDRFAYVLPEESLIGWSFAHVVSATSRNVKEAHLWLDFIMEPETAAEISAWNLATSPNLAARGLLPAEIGENPVLYPAGGVWKGAEIPRSLNEGGEVYIEDWYDL